MHYSQARCRDEVEPILREACSQGYPESAICVQRFDDSLNSAIRITYRISLRSSSLREPRYPLLRVVRSYVYTIINLDQSEAVHSKHKFSSIIVIKGLIMVKKCIKCMNKPHEVNQASRKHRASSTQ